MADANIDPTSFTTTKKFYDDQNFPYGIDRSGDFTIKQAQRLVLCGQAYKALADGSRVPQTADEENFVRFCQGAKAAESADELLWQHYLKVINKPKYYHGVGLTGSVSSYDYSDDDD